MRLEAGLYMLSEFGAKIRLEIDSETWQSVLYAALCRALGSVKTLNPCFCSLNVQKSLFSVCFLSRSNVSVP